MIHHDQEVNKNFQLKRDWTRNPRINDPSKALAISQIVDKLYSEIAL